MAKKRIPKSEYALAPKEKKFLDTRWIAISLSAKLDGEDFETVRRRVDARTMRNQLDEKPCVKLFVDSEEAALDSLREAFGQENGATHKNLIPQKIVREVSQFLASVSGGTAHG